MSSRRPRWSPGWTATTCLQHGTFERMPHLDRRYDGRILRGDGVFVGPAAKTSSAAQTANGCSSTMPIRVRTGGRAT
jgi:hypothetical protein